MFFSIIIPVYNVEPYLRECLDSLFAQDMTDCEVLAVNDGSTDGSRAILAEYAGRYPEALKVVDKANGGLSSARNAGVDKATGDYLYFLDSDDWLKSHAIASIKHAVDVSENADVIYLDCIVTDSGKRFGEHKEKNVPLMDFRSFFKFAFEHKMDIVPNAVSYVYSRAYWKRAGLHFEEGIKYEDTLFKYQIFVREDGSIKAVHVEEPFYVYRVGREGSTTTNRTLRNFVDLQYIRNKKYEILKNNGINDFAFYHGISNGCVTMFYEAWESGWIGEYREFWNNKDVRIMRSGVINEREYGFWVLAKLNPVWMARYYANDLSNTQRRLTNIMLTVCTRLFYRGKLMHSENDVR